MLRRGASRPIRPHTAVLTDVVEPADALAYVDADEGMDYEDAHDGMESRGVHLYLAAVAQGLVLQRALAVFGRLGSGHFCMTAAASTRRTPISVPSRIGCSRCTGESMEL